MTRILLLVAVFSALVGCAAQDGASVDLRGPAPATLREAADVAEAQLGVPGDLVLAVAWIETQWAGVPPDVHDDPGGAHVGRTVGIGGIRPWLAGDPLAVAEDVLGASEEDLDADPALGLLATAVVLRELALARESELPAAAGDWYDVLGDYVGVDHDDIRREYAERVLRVLRRGMQATTDLGEEITVHARAVELPERIAAAREALDAEYDGAHWVPAREGHFRYGRDGYSVTHIIIHTMQGSYEGAISWFRSPDNPYLTSAHYLIRSSDGDITQMVHEADTAHHIGGWNPWTIGIEHEGWIEDPGRWYTDTMYRSSAALTRHLADKYGVPIDRDHILGHVEVPGASHTDPGPGWDWDLYMRLVDEAGGPPLPPHAASLVGSEFPEEMVSGDTAVVWVELQNDGRDTWSLDSTRLGTSSPEDHPSRFFSPDNWLNDHRATPPDHSTYSTGTVGRFTFEIVAPEVDAEETITETFQLVEEGAEWFGPEIEMTIRVVPREGTEPPTEEIPPAETPDPEPDPTGRPDAGSSTMSGGCSAAGGDVAPNAALLAMLVLAVVRRRVSRG